MFLLRDLLLLLGSASASCKNQARKGTTDCLIHRLDRGKLYRGDLNKTETGKRELKKERNLLLTNRDSVQPVG